MRLEELDSLVVDRIRDRARFEKKIKEKASALANVNVPHWALTMSIMRDIEGYCAHLRDIDKELQMLEIFRDRI